MKELLLVQLFCLNILFSQNINVARHVINDATGNMIKIGNRNFYLESVENSCCSFLMNLVCIDLNGNLVFKNNIPILFTPISFKLIKTLDNKIAYMNVYSRSCDYPGIKVSIGVSDTLGNSVFTNTLTLSGNVSARCDFSQCPDSTYKASISNTIYSFSKQLAFYGTSSTLGFYSFTKVYAMAQISNNKIFFNIINATGQLENVITNSLGIILVQASTPYILSNIKQNLAGNIFGIDSAKHLIQFTPSLALISSYTNSVNDYQFRNDSIFVVGNDVSNSKAYSAILNSAMVELVHNNINFQNVSPTGLSVVGNSIQIISTCLSSNSYDKFSSFISTPFVSNFQGKEDIGVYDVSINWQILSYPQQFGNTNQISANAIVKNYGTVLVTSFYLNYYYQCGLIFHYKVNRNIQPGDTIVLQNLIFKVGTGNFTSSLTSIPSSTVCLFTTVPNDKNDINISNDGFCKIAVGINEYSKNSEISMYPNPFSENLKIESTVEVRKLSIINALGQEMKSFENPSNKFEINTSQLKQGIYFMKVETSQGVELKKIIKE
jgi:hypothetical protein